jgi:hypothetical protein
MATEQDRTGPPPPWDRADAGETARRFAAFATYRDLGPERSIRKAAAAFYKDGGGAANVRRLEAWSSEHRWPARAAAYDRWLDAQLIERRREEHLEMAGRHITIAQAAQALVARELQLLEERETARLRELKRRNETGMPIDPELLKPSITPQSLARLLDVAVKTERISAGLATEIHDDVDVEEMTDEELRRILRGDDAGEAA